MADRKFNWQVLNLTKGRDTSFKSDCNAVVILNQTAGTIQINGVNILTGDALTLSGQANEQDSTVYNINWLSVADGSIIQVLKKVYLNG